MKAVNGHDGDAGTGPANNVLKSLQEDEIGSLVALGADVVFLVLGNGVVTHVYFLNRDLAEFGLLEAIGKTLESCVTIESVVKIRAMLSSDETSRPVRGYQINFKCNAYPELPLVFATHTAVDLPFTIVVGRDLRQQVMDQQRLVSAQMELEADYRELQEAETRYRTAFKISANALMMLDGEKKVVLDSNAAAIALLSTNGSSFNGKPARDLFHRQDRDRLIDALSEARHSAAPVELSGIKSARGEDVAVGIRSYRENGITNLIVSLWPSTDTVETARQRVETPASTAAINLADIPEAAVQTGSDGLVLAANNLFLDLIQAPALSQVVGRNIGTWFAKAAIDIRVLYSRIADERTVRGFLSVLTDNLSGERAVSLSARLNAETGSVQLVIIPQAVTPERIAIHTPGVPENAEGFANLVGKVPLKDLMRESLDVIEKICIEAALDQTNNNRAYAAEILGLSRQSLYIKLRRHGLEDYRPVS